MNILSDLSEKKESLEHTAAGTLDARTRLYCLLGSPVSHSISPAMHNEAFRLLGLNCAYLAFDVDESTFERAVDGLITLNAGGWNCTMPLKRLMYERADELSDSALLSGAVNTVVNRDGLLFGDNTDGYGFLKSMSEAGFDVPGKKLTLLGSGGAAAAILAQAALDGAASIDVFARSASASTRLIEAEIGRIHSKCACRLSLYDLADSAQLKKSLAESQALINASSVGMAPRTDASLITDAAWLHPGLFVGDVIYNPRETLLLKTAQEAGCRTFNGMYMLLHQGAKAFQDWTGMEMPVEAVREKYFQK